MKIEDQPIILLGAARSGTKFLRDLIGNSAGFAAVPYDVNYVWRSGQHGARDDVLEVGSVDARQMEQIRRSIRALAHRGGRHGKIVEKSVSNTLRVPFANSVFPHAKFLHIVRDGRAVFESSLRLWKAPPDKSSLWRKLRELPPGNADYVFWFLQNYLSGLRRGRSGGNVWGPRYRGILTDLEQLDIDVVVAKQWNNCVMSAARDLAKLDQDRVLTVRYEDLLQNNREVERVAEFVGVDDVDEFLRRFHKTVRMENLEKWKQSIEPSVLRMIEEYEKPALETFKYV